MERGAAHTIKSGGYKDVSRLILFIFIGVAAALIVTGWQGYKDSPWENFALWKFARSFFVAAFIGIIFYYLDALKILKFSNLGILLLAILSVERAIGELYKGFIRQQSHPEYVKLFEKFSIHFKSPANRVIAGVVFALVLASVILILLIRLTPYVLLLPRVAAGLIIGLFGGMLSAAGGAIKDSQFEGFKFRKFMRSPIVGMLGGTVLVYFSNHPLLLLLSAIGFERVAVELYKTFMRRQIRGVFAGQKPEYPFWLKNRRIFVILYGIGVLTLISAMLYS